MQDWDNIVHNTASVDILAASVAVSFFVQHPVNATTDADADADADDEGLVRILLLRLVAHLVLALSSFIICCVI